jgi:S-adenosylhomocysteine hydrolase
MRHRSTGLLLRSGVAFFKSAATKRNISPFFNARNSLLKRNSIHSLPVLDAMSKHIPPLTDLDKTAIIGVQHILPTTASLFRQIIGLGIPSQNLYFTGKCYSTVPRAEETIRGLGIHLMPTHAPEEVGEYQEHCHKTIDSLWRKFEKDLEKKTHIKRIVILDEGGRCIEHMPIELRYKYSIAAIEQTTYGLNNPALDLFPFHTVEVASSAAKKRLENHVIAESILDRVKEFFPTLNLNQDAICGVAGNGAIGSGIVKYLLSLGYKVSVYDSNDKAFDGIHHPNLYRIPNLKTLVNNSQCIFGCTGTDITKGIDIPKSTTTDKIFISCSSEDKEFLSLLKMIAQRSIAELDPLENIVCRTKNKKNRITILKGGFPINFNRQENCDPVSSIQLTRGLLFGGVIQAILSARQMVDGGIAMNKATRMMLNPYVQSFVVNEWVKHKSADGRYTEEELACYKDIEWIKNNSGGKYIESAQSENLIEAFAGEIADKRSLKI